MKLITLYPGDIGASSEYSDNWIKLITKLGYDGKGSPWSCAYVINVEC